MKEIAQLTIPIKDVNEEGTNCRQYWALRTLNLTIVILQEFFILISSIHNTRLDSH